MSVISPVGLSTIFLKRSDELRIASDEPEFSVDEPIGSSVFKKRCESRHGTLVLQKAGSR